MHKTIARQKIHKMLYSNPQPDVAAKESSVSSVPAEAPPSAATVVTEPPAQLVRDIQDYNLMLQRAQEADNNRSDAVQSRLGSMNSWLSAMNTGDQATEAWAKAQMDAEEVDTHRYSDEEVADMRAALNLYNKINASSFFAQYFVETNQCFAYSKQTDALIASGAANLRFITARTDLP